MISRISRNAVKEGFDTLPAAICYFDRNGLLRLINHRMQEISAVLCGRDLQTLTDLEQALHSPGGGVQLRDEAARELYALILRECTSNGVRHAGATELYADSEHRPQAWHLCITNNGTPPRAEIKEGGGLSSLRRRIEKAGGTVTVHSLPVFVLEVTLPDKESIYDTRYDR